MPEAYADSYEVVIQIHLDGDQWGAVVGLIRFEGWRDSAIR